MQINSINSNMNFKANFSPEFRDKVEGLGYYLIENGGRKEYKQLKKDIALMKELYPDRTIEIIPYMEYNRYYIWQNNETNDMILPTDSKIFINSHKTDKFLALPMMKKMVALTHPYKKTLYLLEKGLNYNDSVMTSNTIKEVAGNMEYLSKKDIEFSKTKIPVSQEEVSGKKARLKELLYG